MKNRRIVPCLDVKKGRIVKGTGFVDLVDAGDPVECAKKYSDDGADEIVLLNISAATEDKKDIVNLIGKVSSAINVPLTVGGGINNIEDFETMFNAGADKVSVNSAAVLNPDLINQASEKYGKERIVIAIDGKEKDDSWQVYISGGKKPMNIDVIDWVIECEKRGAGELLVTSIDNDGEKKGYNIPLLKAITTKVSIPVIASGGAGKLEDFYEAFNKGNASAALAASLFHFGEITIPELKEYLNNK